MGELIGESKKYSERDLDELFDKAAKRGAVLSTLHFDSHGKDAGAVKNSLIDFIARLSKEKGVLYCRGEVEAAIESGDLYSSCAEVRLLTDNYANLVNVSLKYGPIAVEILKPDKIVLTLDEAQNVIVDASNISQDYAKYIYEKTLTGEDLRLFHEKIAARAELGRKILEEK